MKSKLILCLVLVLSGGLFGCSTAAHHSSAPVPPEQNAINALSTLHVGMTIGDADQDLGRYGGMRVFTVSSAVRHSYHYFFISDMNDVTLQFDEHDKLASWQPSKVAAAAKAQLKFVKVDSEETNGQDGHGENAVDGDPNTYWHTQWQSNSPPLPHEIIIELIPPSILKGFTYLPRQDESDHGTIKDYEFYVSNDGDDFGSPVKKGTFEPGKEEKIETFEPVKCRFIKLKAISEINGLPWTSAAEVGVIQNAEDVSDTNLTKQISKVSPLDFLVDIHSLKDVSLKMSEAELLDILHQQKLNYTHVTNHEDSIYEVHPKEHAMVIITFRQGHCGGIQRMVD